ncbi:TPA: S24 family peptidase [Legionella pneumophila]|uniref:LexA family protein n=1 Tax=Legionella pneumophila TaxID=446 RepID=UPI0009B1B9EF|nr:S24 family peptidase [Legionella pneumophila]HAT8908007.1 helix-turn-helix domain-containing protein [Legionella pneumophila subsp. pneumophila]MCW8466079.1 helix-turn-helix domain-containing protein [Legionella pneumophila]MCW8475715.1 helix-turn-helix domain-containing protein [Legionella pneumophila]HAT2030671.1 helix-turn-helix domain-containing protein [Legionella pneumophila]HAU2317752.1 helix-turn-helix domain-containing protein [Legionella pneumophila]
MTELNIKKEIGKRILEARKAKGLTLKALGELAGGLKQTRLTNWEQGVRTPGPEEIKSLARALDVSPAYLMCLSNEMQRQETKNPSRLIPLLDSQQACDHALFLKAKSEDTIADGGRLVSVSTELIPNLSDGAFALQIKDESMLPEFRINDVIIVDPDIIPKPSDFVVALIEEEVIVRKYKQLSASKEEHQFELIALNDDWPDIRIGSGEMQALLIGSGIGLVRSLRF